MLKERFTFKKEIPIYEEDTSPAISLQNHALIEEHDKAEKNDTRPKIKSFVAGPAITRLYEFEELGFEPDELMAMIQELKAAHSMKLLECETCGTKFEPIKHRRYTATSGFNMFTKETLLSDAFDCPKCGCQVIVGNRKCEYKEEEE